jgi:hypothetical protein
VTDPNGNAIEYDYGLAAGGGFLGMAVFSHVPAEIRYAG